MLNYHSTARRAFFGAEAVAGFESETLPKMTTDDVTTLSGRLVTLLDVVPIVDRKKFIDVALTEFESQKYKKLFKDFQQCENEMKSWRGRAEIAEESLFRIQREKSFHVKLTMTQALEEWKAYYKSGHSRMTFNESVTHIESFINSLPQQGKTLLRDATGEHVDSWMQNMRGLPDKHGKIEDVSPVTKKRRRGYLSVFFTFAQRKYKLSTNPIREALPLAGVSRNPENIHAIRRLSDIDLLLNALKPFPYWRAWVAVALFCGPRFSEQVWLRASDVYLEEGYIRIASRASGKRIVGTKTGKERNVPIEKTVLLPILKSYLATRIQQINDKKSRLEDRSPWLFPATVETGPRTLSEAGQWSHNKCFQNAWQPIAKKSALKKPSEVWTYGPAEWRHSFGTLLGMSGWTSLEIGRSMGNNPAVAERFYVGAVAQGNRWPFKW